MQSTTLLNTGKNERLSERTRNEQKKVFYSFLFRFLQFSIIILIYTMKIPTNVFAIQETFFSPYIQIKC